MDISALREFCESGVVTPERMRAVDRNAVALGLTTAQMMESAGKALADAILAAGEPSSVIILCGKGKNGGDGMAAARHLQSRVDVCVWYHDDHLMTPETREQLHLLANSAVAINPIRCPADTGSLESRIPTADLIVDALLGTGAGGDLREPYQTLVRLANGSGVPVLSVDLPTPGIRPARVLAFHRPKTTGAEVAGIGIPLAAEVLTGPGDLTLVPAKPAGARKGAGGKVLVIGGGPCQGAPYLAAIAALRAGADLVKVASPVPPPSPDVIHEPLPGKEIGEEHEDALCHLAGWADTAVCGMGTGARAHPVISRVLPSCPRAVVDADALRIPLPATRETIFTPHSGEFTRVTGRELPPEPAGRGHVARDAGFPGTLLLKGQVDVITDGVRVRFNTTGTPAMTVGGTGDVLAGVTGALLCTLPPFEAACIAAYTTGKAGENAAGGRRAGMLASDLLTHIPQVLYGDR